MGAVWGRSELPEPSEQRPSESEAVQGNGINDEQRKQIMEEEMRKFKEEIAKKREARTEAIKALNRRIAELQEEKDKDREENVKLKEELEKLKKLPETEFGNKLNKEQTEKNVCDAECNVVESELDADAHDDAFSLNDREEVIEGLERQVKALKDVAQIGGEMLKIRELQVNELKSKLQSIEETGAAYEKEVENMKKLRNLYEERARAMTISHQMELEREKSRLLAAETRQKIAEHRVLELEEKNKQSEGKITKLDTSLDEAKSQISELKIKLAGKNEDLYNVTSQMSVVNNLFGQLLSPGQDAVEKITKVLEEHHDLVNHLTANGKINDLASTLVEIADKDPLPTIDDPEKDLSGHLSKVWRLLVELLGHHIVKPTQEEASPESCYKSVETPTGPKVVISVSQTFLRLKDLILEKNTLLKELGRLKDLNSTLETRLLEQESRLSVVTSELHATWSVVNKLKKQHRNLHSNEQVLRYELAQKRLLLNELKKKLEECKENWSLARAKNNQTEKDWKILRSEFALRKQQASSAESGYEESPSDSQDEEDNWKDDKNECSNTSSEDERDPCTLLAWNETEEPKVERRGTLTNTSAVAPQTSSFLNFTVDPDTDSCALLPWTDPSESTSTNDLSSSGIPQISEGGPSCSGLHRASESISNGQASSSSPTNESTEPGPSQPRQRTAEEILQARQDRLRRLEEGCKGLFNKMTQTNQRSEIINSRLTELHEIYGDDSRSRRRTDEEDSVPLTAEPFHRDESPNHTDVNTTPNNIPIPPPFPQVPLYLPQRNHPNSTTDRPPSANTDLSET